MPAVLPSLAPSRVHFLEPLKGLRFHNLEGVKTLPPVDGVHIETYFNNIQIFKTVCEWFASWQPWQQKMFLCGLTDRCSKNQVKHLASALEPVKHRDTSVAVNHRYPSAGLVAQEKRRKLRQALSVTTVSANKSTREGFASQQFDGSDCSSADQRSSPAKSPPEDPISIYASQLVSDILVSSLTHLAELVEEGEKDDGMKDGGDEDEEYIPRRLGSQFPHPPHLSQTPRVAPRKTTRFSFNDGSTYKAIRKSAFYWNQQGDRQVSASTLATSVSRTHRHRGSVVSSGQATAQYFDRSGRKPRLGALQRSLPVLPAISPSREVALPLQKAFKHAAWFGESPREGTTYQVAGRKILADQFNRQMEVVWEWVKEWEDYEVAGLLSEVIKLTSQSLLVFLAQCLRERLEEQLSLNSLPDKVLVSIFSLIPPDDLIDVAHVCRRWRLLCATDELWKTKCNTIGSEGGVKNITQLVEKAHGPLSVDWEQAYPEIPRITTAALNRVETSRSFLSDDASERSRKTSLVASLPPYFGKASSAGDITGDSAIESLKKSDWSLDSWRDKVQLASDTSEGESGLGMDAWDLLSNASTRSGVDGRRGFSLSTSTGIPSRRVDSAVRVRMRRGIREEGSGESPSDLVLDVRPDLSTSTDILGKMRARTKLQWRQPRSPAVRQSGFGGVVKPITRMRKILGHLGSVLCCSIDVRRIVSGSQDCTVRISDIRSERPIHKLIGHRGGVRAVLFNDSKIVSASWDTTLMVWDVIKFERRAVLTGHKGTVTCLAMDSDYIVSGSDDTTARVWSQYGLACAAILRGHSAGVTCLDLDARYIASGSSDMTVRLWERRTWDCARILAPHRDPITCLVMVNELVMCGDMTGRVYFWNRGESECEAAVQAHERQVNSIAFLDGRFFTASHDETVKEWDLVTMTCVREVHGHTGPVFDVKVSKSRIVTCSTDAVRIFDLIPPKSQKKDGSKEELS